MSGSEHIDARIAEVAARQFALVTVCQARQQGLTDRMRLQRVRDGRLLRAGARTLRLPSTPPSWQQRVVAAMLDTGPGAVISHMAAAAWQGFPPISPGAVEITVPAVRRAPRCVAGVVHRSRDLASVDVQQTGVVRVTTPARTLIDIAPRLTFRRLQDCLDWACREGRLTPAHLQTRLTALRRSGRPGITRTADLLARSVSPTGRTAGSTLERMALAVLAEAGLPAPELQAEFQVDGRVFYVDLFFRESCLVIELAGHGTHSTRRERQHDAEREALLASLGLRVITFTYEDVTERPAHVASTVRRLL